MVACFRTSLPDGQLIQQAGWRGYVELIMKKTTINFCGDSYCAWLDENTKQSWGVMLADKLEAKIIGSGKVSTASEHAIKSFNPTSDINVFCWTSSARMYHEKYHVGYSGGVKSLNGLKQNELLSALGECWYRTFFDKEYFNELQMRSLYWFDHEVLSTYKGLAIHLFNFEKTYTFKNGLQYNRILKDLSDTSDILVNHMTYENNKLVADEVFELVRLALPNG